MLLESLALFLGSVAAIIVALTPVALQYLKHRQENRGTAKPVTEPAVPVGVVAPVPASPATPDAYPGIPALDGRNTPDWQEIAGEWEQAADSFRRRYLETRTDRDQLQADLDAIQARMRELEEDNEHDPGG